MLNRHGITVLPNTAPPRKYTKRVRRSEAYKNFRNTLIEEYPYCQKCGSQENLTIHHKVTLNELCIKKNNPKLWDEKNIIILCRKCHDEEH